MLCPHCGFRFPDPSLAPTHCPNCGNPVGTRPSRGLVADYLADLRGLIFSPTAFFRAKADERGLSPALVFGLVTHWIGSACAYLWRSGSAVMMPGSHFWNLDGSGNGVDYFSRSSAWLPAKELLRTWFLGVGSVIADPFTTLLMIVFAGLSLFVGARIFVPQSRREGDLPRPVTYESAARIMSYVAAVSILSIVPLIGSAIAWLYALYVGVVGVKQTYRIDTGRALLIYFFPQLLFFGFLLGIVGLLFVVFMKIFTGM